MKHFYIFTLLTFSFNLFGMNADTNKELNESQNNQNQNDTKSAIIIFSPTAPHNKMQEITSQTAQDRRTELRNKAIRNNQSRVLGYYFSSK